MRTVYDSPVIWSLLLAATVGMSAQQAPPRDAGTPKAAAAAAVVRGRVTSAATGQPLHRVRVSLNGPGGTPLSGVTDTKGAFEIVNVPAGFYTATAVRAGYLTVQYGQRRPREAGRTLEVKDGEPVDGIDIGLVRGGVLSGRISDETGELFPGARVEAIELRYLRGRRVPVAARITATNDAGEFRLSGLEPGPYQIRASSTDVWEGDDGKSTYVHVVTYYPGVTSGDRPESITVVAGQETSGLDVRLIAGAAARITGVVQDPAGAPMAGQTVNLDRITRTTGGALQSAGFGGLAKTDSRGAFEFPKLAAGEYVAYAGSSERVGTTVVVSDGQSRQIVLTPRRPSAIGGSITTDEETPPSLPFARMSVNPVAADPESVFPAWNAVRPQPIRADGTFRLQNLEGPYLFRVTGITDDWMLKSVQLGGRDITDQPLAVTRGEPDVEGLRIVLSRKGAKIAGQVADGAGVPAPDTTVIVFAEDRSMWGLASRFVKAARPDSAGRFSIAGLPAGIYRAIARQVVTDGQWEDPEFLQSLLKDAVRVELTEAASQIVKLTVEPAR